MSAHAYVFDARLADDPAVSRTVVVGSDQTLDDVHGALRQAFEWHGDFPYAFRLDGGRDYAGAPGEGVDVPLAALELRSGDRLEFSRASGPCTRPPALGGRQAAVGAGRRHSLKVYGGA